MAYTAADNACYELGAARETLKWEQRRENRFSSHSYEKAILPWTREIDHIQMTANGQNRELTSEEQSRIDEIRGKIKAFSYAIKKGARIVHLIPGFIPSPNQKLRDAESKVDEAFLEYEEARDHLNFAIEQTRSLSDQSFTRKKRKKGRIWKPHGDLRDADVEYNCFKTGYDIGIAILPKYIFFCRDTIDKVRGKAPSAERFFIVHEYGHIALETSYEREADCWAARELRQTSEGEKVIRAAAHYFESYMSYHPRYGTGEERAKLIKECFRGS